MSSRALQIVTQLSNAPEQTMTSQELAERIGVSAHTIKNEMPQVAQILNENGARLVSRRHKGYYVEVLDPEAYDTFSAVTSIRQMPGSMLNADRESRVRYLSRRIISTETGIKKEQLADQLFLSASALREPLSPPVRELWPADRLTPRHRNAGGRRRVQAQAGTDRGLRCAFPQGNAGLQ